MKQQPRILQHRFFNETFATLLEQDEQLVLEEMARLILDGSLDMNRPQADLLGINYNRLKRFVYCQRHGLPSPRLKKSQHPQTRQQICLLTVALRLPTL